MPFIYMSYRRYKTNASCKDILGQQQRTNQHLNWMHHFVQFLPCDETYTDSCMATIAIRGKFWAEELIHMNDDNAR